MVTIDESQFVFIPGTFCRGTTDAIFVMLQLQEKCLAVGERICMAFFGLEKGFD